ncbi:SDR family oxidoreductase [Peribacillus sp. SCS-26]|uniref:SDR family oxidoreductase n=1 Tax=Paraperibacillus marinus TaxID=3115295 RepID=UPI003905AD43
MGNIYFITGFPGFISNQLVRELLKRDPSFEKAYFLVLPAQKGTALQEINRLNAEKTLNPRQTVILEGDITIGGLGIGETENAELQGQITHVYHLAAIYDLAVPRDLAWKVNVDGTRNVNDWVKNLTRLKRYTYFSTAYVAGTRKGLLKENELIRPPSIKNHYEETKYMAEVYVAELKKELPVTIIRPGIVKGRSDTGETIKFDGPYFILNFLHALKFSPLIPFLGSSSSVVNLVPVDYVIEACAYLTLDQKGAGKTYHLTDPDPYTVTEIYSLLVEAYLDKKPRGRLPLWLCRAFLSIKPFRRAFGVEKEALDYFTWEGRFECSTAISDLAGSGIKCPDLTEGIQPMVGFYSQNRHNPAYQIHIL